jgi:hypothetical protein
VPGPFSADADFLVTRLGTAFATTFHLSKHRFGNVIEVDSACQMSRAIRDLIRAASVKRSNMDSREGEIRRALSVRNNTGRAPHAGRTAVQDAFHRLMSAPGTFRKSQAGREMSGHLAGADIFTSCST